VTTPGQRYTLLDVDGVRVAMVGEPDAPREVLLFMGMLARIDPVEIRRCALLAEQWDARITVADVPGCGLGASQPTRQDRAALRRGHFGSISRRMVRSAQEVNPRLRRTRTMVVGYSLGASLAAAAAADAGLLNVRLLTLVEPVAVRRWNPLQLLRLVCVEDRASDAAVELRSSGCGNAPTRTDLALLGWALSRGRLAADVISASRFQNFSVQLVHGRCSRLCTQRDTERILRILRRNDVDASDLPVAGRHGLWHSMPTVAALAQSAAQQWSDAACSAAT
jgi:pimeloyl-ACP methyl ester carboxylesterase